MSSGAKFLISMLAMPFLGCAVGSVIGAQLGDFKTGGFLGLMIGCVISVIGQRMFFARSQGTMVDPRGKRPVGVDPDLILAPHQVSEILAEDYGDSSDTVLFVAEQSKPVFPSEMFLLPFLQAEFTSHGRLAMIYGTGSGCALIRKTALQQVQARVKCGGATIRDCRDLINALESCGYTVRQDPKLSLDLLD